MSDSAGFSDGVRPELELVGEDGNGFFIVGRARQAARRAGVNAAEIDKFTDEATSGNYDHLLCTVQRYFEVF